ncbi:S-layer homology domain-containing protein [Paenibacillus sp. SYP-B4298]|uniref:S-layer homology domain-containing protein n=1 Tax=Paenibacillus sp. SYP-B4298 TaxID=2996034 RepID=UPI0022DDE42D|nr:S-layer homology domain-containing protein [Paenibacillus sp. SYP-B4298]
MTGNKSFRKFTSLFLSLLLALSIITPSVFAEEAASATEPVSMVDLLQEGLINQDAVTTPNTDAESQQPAVEENAQAEESSVLRAAAPELNVKLEAGQQGAIAYQHVLKLANEIGYRPTASIEEQAARSYIKAEFERIGYETKVQDFSFTRGNTTYNSQNVIATKPGKSSKVLIVGAHYDSTHSGAQPRSTGSDDNASGVGVMLETAEAVAKIETPYTIKFIAFSGEEQGKRGSLAYANAMTADDIANTVAMINLDSLIAGDKMYIYGGKDVDGKDNGWVRELGLGIANQLDLSLQTNPGLNPEYPAGTTGDWSDHDPFERKGITIGYLEATNWEIGDQDGYNQTVEYGGIWHTTNDNLAFISTQYPGRIEERLSTFSQVLTGLVQTIGSKDKTADELGKEYTYVSSMTEENTLTADVTLPSPTALPSQLVWTLGGKPLSAWETQTAQNKKPYVTIADTKMNGLTATVSLQFELLYGTDNLSGSALRRAYPAMIGTHKLEAKLNDQTLYSRDVKITPYESFRSYDEIKPEIDKITANKKEGRYIGYEVLGQSVQGRDMHFSIIAKDKQSVDNYLKLVPEMMNDPEGVQAKLRSGQLQGYKVPIWINNIHPDEAPGVDAIIDLFKTLAEDDTVTFQSAGQSLTLNVDQVLNDVIFLLNYTQNPDGRVLNTRANANGFDLNRDNSYQVQVETQIVARNISKWLPISFLDLHGFVSGFLIEPCSPPHDPNFEYDLFIDNMVAQATAFGEAGIANTKIPSYFIPYVNSEKKTGDYQTGWDDFSPAYTAVFAMHHGALGSTIEIPKLNQDSTDALYYGILGATQYVIEHKDDLFFNQLEFYKRGVNNEDNRKVDEYIFKNGKEDNYRGKNRTQNFFPEYYIIPVDTKLQKNRLEAYKMVEYLLRNGIKVERTTSEVVLGDVTYPAGTYIVNMHQSLRGLANIVLSDGSNVSDWNEMYAEVVQNFAQLRGFDRHISRKVDGFKGVTSPVASVTIPTTGTLAQGYSHFVLKNSSNAATQAVNELLGAGKQVFFVTEASDTVKAGDFVVGRSDLLTVSSKYLLDVAPLTKDVSAKRLKSVEVAAPGSGATSFVLDMLGFKRTSSQVNSDVIVDDSGAVTMDLVKKGKPYIAFGWTPVRNVVANQLIPGLELDTTSESTRNPSHEGLFKASLNPSSTITGVYDAADYLYSTSSLWISKAPESMQVLATASNDSDFYISGWWPNHERAKGQIMGVATKQDQTDDNLNMVLFANTLTNRAHQQYHFRLLSNSIFTVTTERTAVETIKAEYTAPTSPYYPSAPSTPVDSGTPVTPGTPVDPGTPANPGTPVDPGVPANPGTPFTPVFEDLGPVASWAQEAIEKLTKAGILNGVAEGKFAPIKEVTRAEFITMLVRSFDLLDVKATVSFSDVSSSAWYYEYIATGVSKGLIQGVGGGKFDPNRAITREEMAIMSANVLKTVKGITADHGAAALAKFSDQDSIAGYAQDAVALLTENKVINGVTATTFDPKGIANRAQAAVIIDRMLGLE